MKKPVLNLLDVHVTATCNLRCKGCTSFSDYQIDTYYESWSTIQPFLEILAQKVDVKGVAIAGGEPTMHPGIVDIVLGIREIFPTAMIDFVTNGTYLIKKPEIIKTLHDIGHACLTISNHEPNKKYTQAVKQFVLDMYEWRPCTHRADWLETDNQFYLELRDSSRFLLPLGSDYNNLKPHYSDPDAAYKNCCFHASLNYYQGHLYKCAPLQYLPRLLRDWHQSDSAEWQYFLSYKPLSVECSQSELEDFFSKLDKSEPYCAMCPSQDMSDGQHKFRGQWKNILFSPKAS